MSFSLIINGVGIPKITAYTTALVPSETVVQTPSLKSIVKRKGYIWQIDFTCDGLSEEEKNAVSAELRKDSLTVSFYDADTSEQHTAAFYKESVTSPTILIFPDLWGGLSATLKSLEAAEI